MKNTPASIIRSLARADLTIRIGKDAGTGEIWMSQQLGARADPRTYLSLKNLGMMALEFDALGDDKAAEFVRGIVDRIEHSAILETVEASFCFPSTTQGQKRVP